MTSFTTRVPDIKKMGPIVEVIVTPSTLFTQTLQINKGKFLESVRVPALIDTGASGTVVRQDIPEKLGLSPIGLTPVHTPSDTDFMCYQYELQFILQPDNINFNEIVIAAPLEGQKVQCLIGRDILAKAVFIYRGYDNSFTLSFQ